MIDDSIVSPIYLNDQKINALMYADDLVVLAKNETDLQTSLDNLSKYCNKWKLSINTKKTKCMVFNRGNRLCKTNIYIDKGLIENVKSIKYLGFTINAKNCSLANTPIDLSIKARRAIFALNNKIKLSMLPTRLALKNFDTQITPILLYGAEVWGPYGNYTFSNWDKSETEKMHTQFLKRILGCDIHTPNLMIRGELGRRPLLCDAIRRSVMYIKHVELHNGTLANQVLDFEISYDDEFNILSLVRKFTDYYSEVSNYLTPTNKSELKKHVNDNYDNMWKIGINQLSKSDTFTSFKSEISLEKYTWQVKNVKHRIALSRLRLSCHDLMIEKGRHHRPSLERSERKCPYCKDVVEDECHFITSCPLYSNEREELYAEVHKNSRWFNEIPTNNQKFIFILSNENVEVSNKVAAFVYKSFALRASLT